MPTTRSDERSTSPQPSHHPTSMLVTGGAGFIGSNFIRHVLRSSSDLRVVNLDALTHAGNLSNLADSADDDRLAFIQGDVCNEHLVASVLRDHDVDTIVHFAAESHVDRSINAPGELVRTNIQGTYVLLEAARQCWLGGAKGRAHRLNETIRFHQISTDEVFGSLDSADEPFTEASSFAPNSPYSSSKAAADHLVRAYFRTFGLPVTTTHCSNNFGYFQYPEKLIPLIIVNALGLKPIPLYGNGLHIRDWLFVTDHVRAVEAVVNYGVAGETYNVGGNNPRSNIEVALAICERLDAIKPRPDGQSYAVQITYVKDRPGHDMRYAVDDSKLRRELGWQPIESFDSALDKTIAWYLGNSDWVSQAVSGAYRDWIETQYAN
jgi:dTDP-glucose 4,6-dehydratase